eukprot:5309607-Pleurochrysis_carterae.AAC.1
MQNARGVALDAHALEAGAHALDVRLLRRQRKDVAARRVQLCVFMSAHAHATSGPCAASRGMD